MGLGFGVHGAVCVCTIMFWIVMGAAITGTPPL